MSWSFYCFSKSDATKTLCCGDLLFGGKEMDKFIFGEVIGVENWSPIFRFRGVTYLLVQQVDGTVAILSYLLKLPSSPTYCSPLRPHSLRQSIFYLNILGRLYTYLKRSYKLHFLWPSSCTPAKSTIIQPTIDVCPPTPTPSATGGWGFVKLLPLGRWPRERRPGQCFSPEDRVANGWQVLLLCCHWTCIMLSLNVYYVQK